MEGSPDRRKAGPVARAGVGAKDSSVPLTLGVAFVSRQIEGRALADALNLALDRRVSCIVQLQKLNQLGACAAQAALDRADSHLAHDRGFLVGKAARADQRQHLALLDWELGHGLTEVFEIEMAL